jgi:hypothetical protein
MFFVSVIPSSDFNSAWQHGTKDLALFCGPYSQKRLHCSGNFLCNMYILLLFFVSMVFFVYYPL